ncbi:hypothetical protein QAD02_012724 [Eretmocerus hayati]|uniref:Uncharacterized protein n=1 Tax=Eretmocerus hayati TaxID=131215 RepID=A0ACC2P0P6_9HYME|nr:hypothetical protein QAD02_012724 [Eretmocerus hayati]
MSSVQELEECDKEVGKGNNLPESNDTDSTASTFDDGNGEDSPKAIAGQDTAAADAPTNDGSENTFPSAKQSTSSAGPSYSDCVSALARYGSFGVSPLGAMPNEPTEQVGNDPPHSSFAVFPSDQPNQLSEGLGIGDEQAENFPVLISTEDMDDFHKRNSRHAVALALRRDILSIQKKPLPMEDLKVVDLIRGECTIPPDLLNFFKILLNAPIDPGKSPSKAIACDSMAYDAIHNVTRGRVRTSKHITLGMTIKSPTNSKKIITLLNKEGHIASHTSLCELETEATYSSKSRDEVLPYGFIRDANLNPKLVWDNYERAEVHSNAPSLPPSPQPGPSGSCAPRSSDDCEPPLSKKRRENRRSYESVQADLPRVSGIAKVVQTLLPLDHQYGQINIENVHRARKIDFALMLTHYQEIPNALMFFGYNARIHHDPSPKQKVFYLTTMNQSPTDATVVLETMIRTAKAAEESNAPYIESTYDLGIAKNTFQLQSSEQRFNPALKKNFHHIGIFHIKHNYHVALGKFIKECGLSNILIDAGLMGIDSTYSFIFGKNYSRCKRLHHSAYLALELLHFESFLDANGWHVSPEVNQLLMDFMGHKQVFPNVHHEELIVIFEEYEMYKKPNSSWRTRQNCSILRDVHIYG